MTHFTDKGKEFEFKNQNKNETNQNDKMNKEI